MGFGTLTMYQVKFSCQVDDLATLFRTRQDSGRVVERWYRVEHGPGVNIIN
jgi:hypothetical protein